jgi:hypothetical protein
VSLVHSFPWFPIGYALPGGMNVGRLIREGSGYQVIATRADAGTALVLRAEEPAGLDAAKLDLQQLFREFAYAGDRFLVATFPAPRTGEARPDYGAW